MGLSTSLPKENLGDPKQDHWAIFCGCNKHREVFIENSEQSKENDIKVIKLTFEHQGAEAHLTLNPSCSSILIYCIFLQTLLKFKNYAENSPTFWNVENANFFNRYVLAFSLF